MKKIIYILLSLSLLFIIGCDNIKSNNKKDDIKGDYEIGETFSFMNLEVTIENVEKILTIDKELSNDHGKEVLKVPIKVTNKSDKPDHLSMFFYKMYNPKGEEIISKGSYYDDSIDFAPDLEPNESYKKYLYIPYEENGNYTLEFNNLSKKIKIILNINK